MATTHFSGPVDSENGFIGLLSQNAATETPDTTPVAVTRKTETAVGSGVYVIIEAAGTSVPTDGETGFSFGCLFSNPATGVVYINTGNSSSCAFRILELGQSSISGPGAIPLTDRTCLLTTTGADALTLADGIPGQRLTIIMVADGGDGTLTPATATGFTTLTFDDVGDSAELEFVPTLGWMLVGTPTATAA